MKDHIQPVWRLKSSDKNRGRKKAAVHKSHKKIILHLPLFISFILKKQEVKEANGKGLVVQGEEIQTLRSADDMSFCLNLAWIYM